MLFAFIIGLILDAFSNTPGLTAGAMTVTAFMQFPLMNSIVPKDAAEDALPTINLLGKYKYFSYIAILMAIHHIVYFVFEAFNFFNPINLLMRFLATYIVSLLLAWSIEILHTSK
jgi:rod shape-determining protein MreD